MLDTTFLEVPKCKHGELLLKGCGLCMLNVIADAPICPKCGSNETDQLGPVDVTGIETYYKRCDACGHTWDFE